MKDAKGGWERMGWGTKQGGQKVGTVIVVDQR